MIGKDYIDSISSDKKILIIGNKPLTKDYSEYLKSLNYDIIVRINQAKNYDKTKIKTDIILADIWGNSVYKIFKSLSYYEELLNDCSCILNFKQYDCSKWIINKTWKSISNDKVYSVEYESIKDYIRFYIPEYSFNQKEGYRITNSLWIILYMMYTFPNNKIGIFGIDKDYRTFNNNVQPHSHIGPLEEKFLNEQILLKRLEYYPAE